MTYIIIYMTDYQRTMNGVVIDSQYTIPAISNKYGTVIKAYADIEIAKVVDNVIPYKIETENGNLAGYFTLKITEAIPFLYQKQLRPAFQQFDSIISQEIAIFMQSNKWIGDYLN